MTTDSVLVMDRAPHPGLLEETLAEMVETEAVEDLVPVFIDEQIGNQTTAWVIHYSTN